MLAVALVLFASNNWTVVTLNLWGGLQADVKLPVLVIRAFLLGFLPTLLIYGARNWSLRRRIETQGRVRPQRAAGRPQRARAAGDRRPGPGRYDGSPIYVALDTPDLARAHELAAAVRNHVGGIKLGLEFFAANGPAGVREMAALGLPIFLDLKLHDIPNTVAKAVQALRPLEPAILTVHAAGGRAMLEDAKAAAPAGTKVVAVTVLTSLDDDDLAAAGVEAAAMPRSSG